MKTLLIANSKKVLKVDDRDFRLLSQFTWYLDKAGYPYTKKRLHLLVKQSKPGFEIDHEDGDKCNAQRSNLRHATHRQNLQNSRKRKGGTSRFKGVSWHTGRGRWRAVINVTKKQVHLGFFAKEIEAARAYDKAAQKHFKKFARINFPA